jgi:glycosyltransferase involved in cell wall biosynthesis
MEALVDVNIAVYNHAAYLRQTLDSALAQKTNFKFRLLVGDDFSTDGSRDILKEFELKYPEQIKVIYQEKNLGFKSSDTNGLRILKNSTAKYIAFLDGDDYWTDPLKLQKQIDFLESNSDYVLCAANASVINYTDKPFRSIYCHYNKDQSFDQRQILLDFYCPTLSMVFRNCLYDIPDWFHKVKSGDTFLHLLLSQYGKFYYMDFIAGVYRQHSAGISNINNKIEWYENNITYLRKIKPLVKSNSRPFLNEIIYRNQLEYLYALREMKQYNKAVLNFFIIRHIPFSIKKEYFRKAGFLFVKILTRG